MNRDPARRYPTAAHLAAAVHDARAKYSAAPSIATDVPVRPGPSGALARRAPLSA